jgi:transcriptional regulator with XRE-family HTH domain
MPTYTSKPKPLPIAAIEAGNRHSSKEEFAKRLVQALDNKGWNQSQLARYAGLARDAVSTYVRARSLPSPDSLKKLAACLGVKPEDLLPNYFEAASNEQAARMEIKEIHGEDGYMWLKVNMRLPKAVAIKVFMLINEPHN